MIILISFERDPLYDPPYWARVNYEGVEYITQGVTYEDAANKLIDRIRKIRNQNDPTPEPLEVDI